jgi:hypothetical protein
MQTLDDLPTALVIEAELEADYRVRLRFDDGLAATVDLIGLFRDFAEIFAPLRDTTEFQKFRLTHGALEWPEHELDVSPEYLWRLASETPRALVIDADLAHEIAQQLLDANRGGHKLTKAVSQWAQVAARYLSRADAN